MDARNALAFYNRGLVYWDRREFDRALADFEQAIRINPGYAPTYYSRGLAYLARRDYDRAIQDLNQAINGRPNYPLAFNIRGLAYIAKGDDRPRHRGFRPGDPPRCEVCRWPTTTAARPTRASAISTARSPTSIRRSRPIRTTTRRLQQPRHRAIATGATLKARSRISSRPSRSIRRARRHTTTVASRCGTRATTRNAVADFEQAIKLDPRFAAAYANRGTAYYDKREYNRAIADFDQAIRLSIRTARSRSTTAASPIATRATAAAPSRISIRRSRSMRSSRPAYASRGLAYSNRRDYNRAIADLDNAIRLDGKFAGAYNDRGLVNAATGKIDRAIADFTQAIRLNPNYDIAYNNRGLAYRDRGDIDRAIEDFNQAVKVNPKYDGAYQQPRPGASQQGRYRRAPSPTSSQAIDISPNFDAAYGHRGQILRGKGDVDRAIKDFDGGDQAQSERVRHQPATAAAARLREAGFRPRDGGFRTGDQARSELRRRLQRAWHGARRQGRARPRHRRLRPGDPAQSELRCRLQQPRLAAVAARRYDRAIADFDQAIRINPGLRPAYHNRGLAQHDRRRLRARHRRT